MAPEILEDKIYDGRSTDLFAAGICLFIMVTGKLPFKAAKTDDEHFSYLVRNKSKKFWAKHETKNKFSQEFKELVTAMLQYERS